MKTISEEKTFNMEFLKVKNPVPKLYFSLSLDAKRPWRERVLAFEEAAKIETSVAESGFNVLRLDSEELGTLSHDASPEDFVKACDVVVTLMSDVFTGVGDFAAKALKENRRPVFVFIDRRSRYISRISAVFEKTSFWPFLQEHPYESAEDILWKLNPMEVRLASRAMERTYP